MKRDLTKLSIYGTAAVLLAGCLNFVANPPGASTGNLTKMVFAGAQKGNAVWVTDPNDPSNSTVQVVWNRATNASGAPYYDVYSSPDYDASMLLGRTVNTTFSFKPQVSSNGCFVPKAYNIAVEAEDALGFVKPDSYAQVVVLDPRPSCRVANFNPPTFAGVALVETATQQSQTLKWLPCTDTDFLRYDIYNPSNLSTPIGSTVRNYYVVNGLLPNTTYSYIVRATNISGIQEKNTVTKTDTTLSYSVPTFGGLTNLALGTGPNSVDQINLSWVPVAGVTGYRIFQRANTGDDFQVATTAGNPLSLSFTQVQNSDMTVDSTMGAYLPQAAGTLVSSESVMGLAAGTSYTFVVQAFTKTGGYAAEFNRVDRTIATASRIAVTKYPGASSAVPAQGEQGFSQIYVNFPTPVPNGVWNSFRIDYGPSNGGAGAYPFSMVVNDPNATQAAVTANITPLVSNCFRVRAEYNDLAYPPKLDDTNTTEVCAIASPKPPVFAGIQSLVPAPLAAGYHSLNATFFPATGSFSYYEVSISPNPDGTSSPLVLDGNNTPYLKTNSITTVPIVGLNPNVRYTVQVRAIFTTNTVPPPNNQLTAGDGVTLKATTTPIAPSNTSIAAATVTSPQSILLSWNAPTLPTGFLMTHYWVWKRCVPNGNTSIVNLLNDYFNSSLTAALAAQTTPAADSSDPDSFKEIASGTLQQPYAVTSNLACGFIVRSVYHVQSDPILLSTEALQTGTPGQAIYNTAQLQAPTTFIETNASVNRPQPESAQGFTNLIVTLNNGQPAISALEKDLLGRYQVAYRLQVPGDTFGTNTIPNWNLEGSSTASAGTVSTTSWDATSILLPGLTPRSNYFIWVRATNDKYPPSIAVNGGTNRVAPGLVTTTPPPPKGDSFANVGNGGVNSLYFSYTFPGANPATSGLWSDAFVYVYQRQDTNGGPNATSATDVLAYEASVEAAGITDSNITKVMNSTLTATLTAAASGPGASPLTALIRVPNTLAAVQPGKTVQFTVSGLTTAMNACIVAVGVYYDSGDPKRFLKSVTVGNAFCGIPKDAAPTFDVSSRLTDMDDNTQNFNNLEAVYSAQSCTSVNIYVGTSNSPLPKDDPNAIKTVGPCTGPTAIAGSASLLPNTVYYVQYQAVGTGNQSAWWPTISSSLTKTTAPPPPVGGSTDSTSYTAVPLAPDQVTVNYHAPTDTAGGPWNTLVVYKGTSNNSQAEAIANLDDAVAADDAVAKTVTLLQAPNAWKIISRGNGIDNGTSGSVTDNNVLAGQYNCYVVLGAYLSGGNFSRAVYNDSVDPKCAQQSFSAPTIGRLSKAELETTAPTTWTDGTAKIKLTLQNSCSGDCEQILVWYHPTRQLTASDLLGKPWQVITVPPVSQAGSAVMSSHTSLNVDVGGLGRTVKGSGWFVARANFVAGITVNDTNLSNVQLTAPVPSNQSNYVAVPKAVSGLSYDYYIATFEAQISAAFGTATALTTDSLSLRQCNAAFATNTTGEIFNASCSVGTPVTSIALSQPNTPLGGAGGLPAGNANFSQAWQACRNATAPGITRVRLPTEEEWRRAARWSGTYSNMWPTYTGSACNTTSGSVRAVGNNNGCISQSGALDMAGNVREWVDNRMVQYNVSNPPTSQVESRFGYGPNIGSTIDNGIDGVIRRFHLFDPGALTLALALGSDYVAQSGISPKQYDAESELWQDQTTSTGINGFRCAMVWEADKPTVEQLSLPTEPVYVTADLTSLTIPEKRFLNDTKPASVKIAATGGADSMHSNGDATHSYGTITLSWVPWTKKYYDVASAGYLLADKTQFNYEVWRFTEPVFRDIRPATMWAVPNTTKSASTNPYNDSASNGGVPVDPLDPRAVAASNWVQMVTSSSGAAYTVAGTACSATLCTFTDDVSKNWNNFSPLAFYRYVVVVKDESGNRFVSRMQRFQSPYFSGAISAAATPTFRTEIVSRPAGVFLIDETYQTAQTTKARQSLVHVPMDKSGLDRDFFIQKYEPAIYSGPGSTSWQNDVAYAAIQGAFNQYYFYASASWRPEPAQCHETYLRTGTAAAACGGSGNGASMESLSGVAPYNQGFTGGEYGATYKACRNSSVTDANGNVYGLKLSTSAEWTSAADWGNTAYASTVNGTPGGGPANNINDGPETGNTVMSAVTYCNTVFSNTGAAPYPWADWPGPPAQINNQQVRKAGSGARCRSRYGAFDMVGNFMEQSSDNQYNLKFLDGGVDSIQMGSFSKTSAGTGQPNTAYSWMVGLVARTSGPGCLRHRKYGGTV